MSQYLFEVLVGLDQLFNTVLGGWADETMSSRAFRLEEEYWFWHVVRMGIDTVFYWQTAHCFNAYISERMRSQAPPELRTMEE